MNSQEFLESGNEILENLAAIKGKDFANAAKHAALMKVGVASVFSCLSKDGVDDETIDRALEFMSLMAFSSVMSFTKSHGMNVDTKELEEILDAADTIYNKADEFMRTK